MGTQEGEGKYFIWEKNHGLLVLKQNHKISENPNANADWTITWRLKMSTRVINKRA